MKVRLSSLWRRGGRNAVPVKRRPEAPAEAASAPAPSEAPAMSPAAPNWPTAGTAAMACVAEDEKPRLATPQVKQRSEAEISLQLQKRVATGQMVWLVLDDGSARAGVIRNCSEEQGCITASVGLIQEPSSPAVNGEAPAPTRVKWVNTSSEIVQSPASLQNSQPGRLQVSLTEPAPVSALVLVSAASFQSLGSITSSEQEGDRWLAEVEVLGDAFSVPGPRPV